MSAKKIESSAQSPAVSPHPSRLLERPLSILHVDDSTDDQLLFQAACQQAQLPIQSQVADSTERAISRLQELLSLSKAQAVPWPDVVVLDIQMPGEKGFKVLEYIRSTPELRPLPVVVLTGVSSNESMTQAYALGANSFHEKPNCFEDLVQLVVSLYTVWSASRRPALGEK